MRDNTVQGSLLQDSFGGSVYKIENVQQMPPFFINVASNSDIWMFLSSNGALTAGRKNADGAIFPYETDDRLHQAAFTGPKTLIRIEDGRVWEPFETGRDNPFEIRRNLYKSTTGDFVVFEEINDTLGLTFNHLWTASERYGIVRTASIHNHGTQTQCVAVLDGVQNVIPYGIHRGLSESSSCLTDAYKACERVGSSLAVYSLTSAISDTPEPVEMLHANVVWSVFGQADHAEAYLLSAEQIGAFCAGRALTDETRSAGRKSAYFTYRNITLEPNQAKDSWMTIMDTALSQADISRLLKEIETTPREALEQAVREDVKRCAAELNSLVAMSDGLQCTQDRSATARHYMNVLYNVMRGGVFPDGYRFDYDRFAAFVQIRNKQLIARHQAFFDALKASGECSISGLKQRAFQNGDPDLIRLCLEFLPLSFSRRHGDPSRPWNHFHIDVKDADGNRKYHYEGNWRDIFQNWEALGVSFPEYLEHMVAKFLNATSPDGFNPYRINGDGIDWESPQPDNPFSGYGYWGDHQIIYLLKLLELLEAYAPDQFNRLISDARFCYANIPYEINPYEQIVKDAKNTITFDFKKDTQIKALAERMGTDGRLLPDGEGVYYAPFIEKLLIPVLAKLSNLVINGGIWMNTQRPEWNDANNAIVGNGLSMVTVYQLYRHLNFIKRLAKTREEEVFTVSQEVSQWLHETDRVLQNRTNQTPRAVLDALGAAFGQYRATVYTNGFCGRNTLTGGQLAAFLETAVNTLAETISQNKRADGLYNAYNILKLEENSLSVSAMFPMLEGQTAVLSSGILTPSEAAELVTVMENSGLYSPEHKTFYLYPIKQLKTFMERNIIPCEMVKRSELIQKLIADKETSLVYEDAASHIRFNENIRQSADLEKALETLRTDYASLIEAEKGLIGEAYEQVFQHRQFTGRSGIMYKYEGIGCIYWHQNSKFILSFQDCINTASQPADLPALKAIYYRLQAGLGFNKQPSLWGAFPLEPYSHTPLNQPAQQPGMTGQVKEDILSRFSELGLFVREGRICFKPLLLRRQEFLEQPTIFRYISLDGKTCELPLEAGSLAFTLCQTPIMYRLATANKITVYGQDGSVSEEPTLTLDTKLSRSLFEREGRVARVVVDIKEDELI